MSPSEPTAERSDVPARTGEVVHRQQGSLWELVFSRENLSAALKRVEANRGAAGVDGMGTEDLRPWLVDHWPQVREALDAGVYRPLPVRRVAIPKPGGGERLLGVPGVLDRLVQQAIAQVLGPIFDPHFSGSSFGFRPGRSAHQAVRVARRAIEDGHRWVVDVDLDRFFDRVQHDALMARVARRVGDRRVLRLIRRFLEAGIMADGVVWASEEGTPQGSPLSPLLSNVMLDDLDRELWQRGHRFVRYADDIRVFVRSRRAAHRVLDSVTAVVEQRLKLKVSREKSKVVPASVATLLGFGFYFTRGGVRIRADPKVLKRFKDRIRELTSRRRSIAMDVRIAALNRYVTGWWATSGCPTPPGCSGAWMSGSVAACGRSGGRNGSGPRLVTTTWFGEVSTRPRRGSGRPAARATGASLALQSLPGPCRTPIGTNSACGSCFRPGNVSDQPDEPPDAGPHVRWCEWGVGRPDPPTRFPIPHHGRSFEDRSLAAWAMSSKVMIVDDHPLIRMAVRTVLTESGMTVNLDRVDGHGRWPLESG